MVIIKTFGKARFLTLFSCFIAAICFSQTIPENFTRKKINPDSIKKLLERNKIVFMGKFQKLHPYVISEHRQMYEEKVKTVMDLISLSYFITNDSINTYLNNILQKINKVLPQETNQFILLLDPTLVPNAASYGNGIIIINIGLLTKYETEDELAFVICHEIAHDILLHNYQKIIREKKIMEEVDFNRKYKRAKRARYNRPGMVKSVTEDLLLKTTVFNRFDELQADSLGFLLLKKAGYKENFSVNSLKILEKADDKFFEDSLALEMIFSFDSYPFQVRWLPNDIENEEKTHPVKTNDSLKTHPDCRVRINKIIQNFIVDTSNFSPTKTIYGLNEIAFFENLHYCYSQGNVLLSLYFALHLQEKQPTNEYLTMVICHSLFQMGSALKKHRFSYYVPLPNIDFDADLNRLIGFLNNLDYGDYKELVNQFYKVSDDKLADSKYRKRAKIYTEFFDLTEEEVMNKIKAIN